MVHAKWGLDYDFRTDKTYKCPVCGKCREATIVRDDLGNLFCCNCQKEVHATTKMRKWFEDRSGSKEETDVCFKCGEKTMRKFYCKNPVTLEWQLVNAGCEKCNIKIFV